MKVNVKLTTKLQRLRPGRPTRQPHHSVVTAADVHRQRSLTC